MRAAPACLLVLALVGCSYFRDKPEPRETGIIYSPNGEPLSGGPLDSPTCSEALGRWFDRVDQHHDGTIDLAEFLTDARRQFDVMDLEKSGVLTPAVLAQYRAPYITRRNEAEDEDADEDTGNGNGKDRGRRRRDDSNTVPIGVDRADPVMLADVSLRNQVTRDQFLAYARRNFATLDKDRTGRLGRGAVLATCRR